MIIETQEFLKVLQVLIHKQYVNSGEIFILSWIGLNSLMSEWQVSKTFLNVQDDLNRAVICMVSILHLIFSSPALFPNICWLFQKLQLQIISLSFSCSTTFSAFWQDSRMYFSYLYHIIFILWWQISFAFKLNLDLIIWSGFPYHFYLQAL